MFILTPRISCSLVIQVGAAVNVQDHDGWTPLHAAAHWGQREACELLCENYANMDVKNYVGQTCFDVADPGKLTDSHFWTYTLYSKSLKTFSKLF